MGNFQNINDDCNSLLQKKFEKLMINKHIRNVNSFTNVYYLKHSADCLCENKDDFVHVVELGLFLLAIDYHIIKIYIKKYRNHLGWRQIHSRQ